MPINTSLLIAAPMLQDLLIDATGEIMAGGTITLYHDNQRLQLKNWYYQTGAPGAYTWTPLPNPLTLSAAGTISDVNGVDTIPFYYPYLESDQTMSDPYYIVIQNAAQTNTITRSNFPYLSGQGSQPSTITTFNNLIVNNGFWRNILPNGINTTNQFTYNTGGSQGNLVTTPVQIGSLTTLYTLTVSPSQHDGYSLPDCVFMKDTFIATDKVTFTPFTLSNNQPIFMTNSPEYYISHNSTAGGGEALKCYQFPIALHVNNLKSLNYTVSIQAQSQSGAATMQLKLMTYCGMGVATADPSTISSTNITLSTAWQTYTRTDVFPSTTGLVLGAGGDDAFYLQVWLPLNAAFTINFTKPSLYLTDNTVPAVDFQSYDVVNSIIASPRTGDVRVSTNNFTSFGWATMNDGLIGLAAGASTPNYYSRANQDTWQLFNLLWNIAKSYDAGATNPICQLFDASVNPPTTRHLGASAYADFTASNGNYGLQLTKSMGRNILGGASLTNILLANLDTFVQLVTSFTNGGGGVLICTVTAILAGTNQFFYQGQPVVFSAAAGTLPTGLTGNVVYVTNITGVTFQLATTYTNAIANVGIITAATGGTFFVYTSQTGTRVGEYQHTQLPAEVAAHQHPFLNSTSTGTKGSNCLAGAGVGVVAEPTENATGANSDGSPFNITQPGTYYNLYIKL